jgi:hypothetical protein
MVEGIVRFNSTGDLSVGVNLIIIGIPNWCWRVINVKSKCL